MVRGELAEIFGKDALVIDEFMRYVGLARVSKETWDSGTLSLEEAKKLQAYADGVNDYVQGVSLFGGKTDDNQQTARVLPPEFLTFGITKESYDPWTPVDSLLMVRFISFQLTWNWFADLQREAMRQSHPDLAALLEEIMPFTTDHLEDMVPIIDDDDLKRNNMYSEELLVDKYRKAADRVREASPPLPETHTAQELSSDLK